MTWDTAQEIARAAQEQAGTPLELSPDDMSAALVRVAPGVKVHDVAVLTLRQVPGVTPIERSAMFQAYRHQLSIYRQAMTLLLIVVLLLSLAIIALVSTAAANEQRQQVYVLRALGATRGVVLRTLLAAAGVLALAGAFLGSILAVGAVYLLRDMLIRTVGLPYVAPSAGVMLPLLLGSLLLAFAMVASPRSCRPTASVTAIRRSPRGNKQPARIWCDSVEEVMPCLTTSDPDCTLYPVAFFRSEGRTSQKSERQAAFGA